MSAGRTPARALALGLLLVPWLPAAPGAAGPEQEEWLDGWIRGRLEQVFERALGARVRMDRIETSPWSLGARIEGFEMDLPAPGADPLRLRAAAVHVRWAWSDLLAVPAGRIHLSELHLERPDLSLDDRFVAAWTARRPRGRPIELRLDRFSVRGGRLRYEDLDQPLDFRAEALELSSEWSSYRHALVGRFTMETSLLQPPLARPLPLRFAGGFALERRRLDLSAVRVEGPGISAELGGHAVWGGGVALRGEVRVEVEAEALAPWLRADFPEVGGRLAGRFDIERMGGPIVVRGRCSATGARFGPLEASRAEADVTKRASRLDLGRLLAEAYGGQVAGSVGIELGESPRFEASLSGTGLDLERLLGLVGRPLPFAADARLDLELGGEARDRATWNGSGAITCRAKAGEARRMPVSGSGRLRFDEGRFRLEETRAEMAAAGVRIGADLDLGFRPARGSLTFDGTTADAGQTQAAVLGILEALEVPRADVLSLPLTGTGSFSTRVGVGGPPETALRLSLAGGSWDEEAFDSADLDAVVTAREVEVRWLRLVHGPGVVDGAGRFSLGDRPQILALEGRATEVDLGRVLHRFASRVEASGALSAELSISRRDGELGGRGRLEVIGGRFLGERFDRAEAEVEVAGGLAILSEIVLEGPALAGQGRATVGFETGATEVVLERGQVRFFDLEALRNRGIGAFGEAELEGTVRYGEEGPSGNLTAKVRGLGLALGRLSLVPVESDPVEGALGLDPAGLSVHLGDEEGAPWGLRGTMRWDGDLGFGGDLDLRRVEGSFEAGDGSAVRARLAGRFRLDGPLARPAEMALSGALEDATLRVGLHALRSPGALPLALRDGVLRLGPGGLEGSGARLEGSVVYGLGGGDLEIDASGQADLGVLVGSWPDLRGSGPVTVELRARGTVEQPDVSGTLRLEGGRLRHLGLPGALEHVAVVARFDRDRVTVEEFTALLGGGEVRGTGEAALSGLRLASYRLGIEARDVVLGWPEGFRAVYRGTLAVEGGRPEPAVIRGRLEMLQGLYDQEFRWGQMLGAPEAVPLPADRSAFVDKIQLDVDLAAGGNVWIRNETARIESRLDLHLGGTVGRPELTGRIWLYEGGTVRFREVEYRVLSGTVDFTALGRIRPYLDLRAQTRVPPYDVLLHVEGTADHFTYELTSDPPLSQQDIIALLLTGSPLAPRASAGDFTGDLAANYFAGALSDRYTRQLRRALGLERLEVNPLLIQGSADPTTRITVGKRVSEDVRLIYSTDVGSTERRLYQVDWEAMRNLRLSASRDTTGGVGGEIEYQRRFGGTPAGSVETPHGVGGEGGVGPGESESGPAVEAVEIAGLAEAEAAPLEDRLGHQVGRSVRRVDVFQGSQRIRETLVRKGRIEAKVRAQVIPGVADPDRVRILYEVEPGPRVRVELSGVRGKDRRRLLRKLDAFWLEAPFGSSSYEDAAGILLDEMRARGFYAAVVEHEIRDPGPEREIRFSIEPGSLVRVRDLRVDGATAFEEAELLSLLSTQRDDALSRRYVRPKDLDEDVETLRRFYLDAGYLDVSIAPPRISLSLDGEDATVRFGVEEGRRYLLSRVGATEGLEVPAARLVEDSGLAVGQVFSPSRLLEAEARLRASLDEQGYPDARVESDVSYDETGASVALRVEPGDRKTIGAVELLGLRVTRPKVVRRELAFEVGDPLSTSALLETQHRLYRLGLFRSARLTYEPMTGSDMAQVVRVRVEEAPPVRLGVGAGYDSEAGPRGSLSIAHQNVWGYGRELALQGKASEIERRVQLVAKEPRLFNRSLEALLSTFWERREQVGFTVTRRATALRVERKLRPGWTRYVRYNYQTVDLRDVVNPEALQKEKLENLRLGDVSVAVVRDTRDDLFLPTRGGYAGIEGRFFAPVFLSDASFVKLLAQGSMTHSFGKDRKLAFASGLRIGMAWTYGPTATVPLSERFFAGGESTLRGFPRDGVGPRVVDPVTGESRPAGGEAMLLFNEEFRFPILWRLKGVVFYDAGNVYSTLSDSDPSDLRHAAGLGLRLETPIGPLRLEYGRKLDREAGESEDELFFAIGSVF